MSVVWKMAQILGDDQNPQFAPLFSELLELAGLPPPIRCGDAGSRSIRYIQAMIASKVIHELDPTIAEAYWLTQFRGRFAIKNSQIISLKLRNFCRELGIAVEDRDAPQVQAVMSFASWSGLNGIPMAA